MKETEQKNNEKRLEAGIKRYVEYVTTNLIRLNSADYTYEVNYNSNAFNFYFPHEKHFKHLSATAEDIKDFLLYHYELMNYRQLKINSYST